MSIDTPLGLFNFAEGYYNSLGVLPVKSSIDGDPPNGFRFDGASYVILDKNTMGRQTFEQETYVKLSFKTFAREGLLFLIGNNADYFSIYLREGRVYVVYDLGSGYATIASRISVTLNDGNWHTLDVARQARLAILKVDEVEHGTITTIGQQDALETDDNVYIGGHPEHYYNEAEVTKAGFEGCIKDVQVTNRSS